MDRIRQPAVAGMFYPADEQSLRTDIQRYLQNVSNRPQADAKALIVPHAGYMYSGPVAASAYKQIIPLKNKVSRVVLLGPSHRVAFNGLAIPDSEFFNTPLGNIPVDQNGIQLLSGLPQVIVSERAHLDEHSLEVQLPFLQETLGDFSLIPLVVGNAEPHEIAQVINLFWDDENTLIIISTDLSHFHEYTEAQKIDSNTNKAIMNLKPELISYDDACGRNGLQGLLTVAKEKGLSIELLDMRNSGDTAGDKNRVVGYAAYVLH